MNKHLPKLVLLSFITIPFAILFLLSTFIGLPEREYLPRFYAETDLTKPHMVVNDTAWHIIPPFNLVDQDSSLFTEKDMEGKVVIADFIFTTCPGICPVMTAQMSRVHEFFKDDPTIHFISHSVDPVRDTPKKLKRYGDRFEADFLRWSFLTGERDELYELSQQGYKLGVGVAEQPAEEEFDHSGRFVLVDRDRIIRGYYQGIDTASVNQLLFDAKTLQLEYYEKPGLEYRPGERNKDE